MDNQYSCYDCAHYDYEDDACKSYDYIDVIEGICEDFIHPSEYEDSVGYEDDGYPD